MRAMKESGDAFRVREEVTGERTTWTLFHGPYATVGTAKAQRSRREREIRRSDYYRVTGRTTSRFIVEKTSTDWQEVPE